VLRNGVKAAGYALEALVDSPPGPWQPPGRAWRWAAAALPWQVPTTVPAEGSRLAPDVFRRAQVHFDLYGRFLPLRGRLLPALMHWSYPLPLHLRGVLNIYSVLDLIPLLQPHLTPIRQARARRMLTRLKHEAAHLVTISETSRREIITTLDWPPERVTNTYLAVDVAAEPSDAVAEAGLEPGGYFLHVGTVERRKNIARLLQAYRASGSHRALVLAGPDGWGAEDELAHAAGLLVTPGEEARSATGRPRVLRLPWLNRAAVISLMQGATAVVAPSLAEGFGLPVAEAMALGTPALTSQGGAPQEITGEAAALVDPAKVCDIAAGLQALDTQPALRAQLAAAGLRRAALFSPQAYAARLAALYGAL
jgi:glycosyltransferase involved in cell wall biosynthesis